ncbi:MAG: VWA domain-containing protein [Acidimicrobiales bacterium]
MSRLLVLRPGYLALLLVLPAVVVAWRRWPPPLTPGRSRLTLALRLTLLSLVALSLADVRVARRPRNRAVVAVVDLSDSTAAAVDDAATGVTALIAAKGPGDLFGVVTFGRDAQVELPPTRRPVFSGFQTRPDPGQSDLAGALVLAANLIPDGFARQLVLVSDGRQNLGDASEAVAGLRSRAVRVDVAPIGGAPSAETLVAAIEAPGQVRVGQVFTALARLRSTDRTEGRIVLSLDGREVASRQIELPAGGSEQRFEVPPLDPGTHRLSATLDARPDRYLQNNVAEAVVRVLDRPSVLVLEGGPGGGANVGAALEAAGMRVQRRPAAQAPSETALVAAYDGVVIADAAADSFPPGALGAITASVRDLGRGLVAIGGPSSYGPGGWGGTALEEALPVRMEIPRPKERPAVAVAVLMETMEDPTGDAVALGSVDAVVDQLRPDDELAVINMSTAVHEDPPSYVVPLGRPADKPALKRRIRETTLGDPGGYGRSMSLALDGLARSTAPNRNVILLGDGDAVGDVGNYQALFERTRSLGVTVSSIGVATHDSEPDMEHMRAISQLGGGRFYRADSASAVPEILLEASRSTLRSWYEQDRFFPKVTSAGDLLEGVPLDAFPELGGYVATTAKPTADVVLSSPKGDPVLAGGQYGLGRAVAWTSDARGRWTSGLLRSPVSAALFGRMVAWSLPAGEDQGLRIDTSPTGVGLDVTVSGPAGGGDGDLRVVSPTQATTEVPLRAVAPGRWQADVAAPEVGTYVLHAALRQAGAVTAQAEKAVPVPYGLEYLEPGRDDGFLARLAARSGTVLAHPAAAWAQPTLPLSVTSPVFWLLLLLFAIAWPIDIAIRRVTLSPRELVSAVRHRHRQPEPGTS